MIMNIQIIKNESQYDEALERLNEIFEAKAGSPEAEELEILSLLVDDYEQKHHPIEAPDPIEAIKIRMQEMDLKQKDLVAEIGSKSRVSEVLNRKRKLTLDMIRKLEARLNLSAELLINDYKLAK